MKTKTFFFALKGANRRLAAIVSAFALVSVAGAETIDLSTVTRDTTIPDGATLTGALAGDYKLSIAAGATVTLRNAVVHGSTTTPGAYNWGGGNEWAGLTCLGSADIILEGQNVVSGCQAWPAIFVPENNTLCIRGSGALEATGGNAAAGIGGGWGIPCGNIEIMTGTITVEAPADSRPDCDGAAIGGGYCSKCGDITISGGTVTATGRGAGIGGGWGSMCGDIVISGGRVVAATTGEGHAGIGGGAVGLVGDIILSGGNVVAIGGDNAAGIGCGRGGECGSIEIDEDVSRVEATCGAGVGNPIGAGLRGVCAGVDVDSHLDDDCGSPTRTIYSWNGDLSQLTYDVTVLDGKTVYGMLVGDYKVSIAAGATVTLSNAVIHGSTTEPNVYNWGGGGAWAGLTCLGSATIVLEGRNSVRGCQTWPAVFVPENNTLVINGPGSLAATGGDAAAGIGGGWGISSGSLVIRGGTITAEVPASSRPESEGAAIGAGYCSRCGNITISGGTVTATGRGAGIGGGWGSMCGDIIVSGGRVVAATMGEGHAGLGGGAVGLVGDIILMGGYVTATGGDNAAGIGCGRSGECGAIMVDEEVARVEATRGAGSVNPIGAGVSGKCDGVYVDSELTDDCGAPTRTIFFWNGDLSLLTGAKTISSGMTVYGTLSGCYKVSIESGATVTLSNAVVNGENSSRYSWAGLTCLGDATIILEGVNTMQGFYEDYPGIYVPQDSTLTIRGDGELSASGCIGSNDKRWAAGIGGGYNQNLSCGNIVIEGGTITATGGSYAAGIGGGWHAKCGSILIRGGTVTSTGGEKAAGIGGSISSKCDSVTIGAGIVRVTATRDAGFEGDPISTGETTFTDVPDGLRDSTSADGLTRTLYRYWNGNLAALEGDMTVPDGMTVYGTLLHEYKVSIEPGATVTLSDAVINGVNNSSYSWAGLTCLGDATIVLDGYNDIQGFYEDYPGIYVPPGATLRIRGDGALNAIGSLGTSGQRWGAGIGGGYNLSCGNIVIDGGTVTATGGKYAAGIGSGSSSNCGAIGILEGIVQVVASCGVECSNPIGAGKLGKSPTVPYVAPSLKDETSADGMTRTISVVSDPYAVWAKANGVSGAWNATDANGIANVFRYAFDVPTGGLAMLTISFDGSGRAVVSLTQPLVNGKGFSFSIVASDALDGTGNVVRYAILPSGEMSFAEPRRTVRFFRLEAVPQ